LRPAGKVSIADEGNHRVRRVSAGGTITHWLGNGANVLTPSPFDGMMAELGLLLRPQGAGHG